MILVWEKVRLNILGVGSNVARVPAREVENNIRQLDIWTHLNADVAGTLGNRGDVELEVRLWRSR